VAGASAGDAATSGWPVTVVRTVATASRSVFPKADMPFGLPCGLSACTGSTCPVRFMTVIAPTSTTPVLNSALDARRSRSAAVCA
jgi:hypothetical protein